MWGEQHPKILGFLKAPEQSSACQGSQGMLKTSYNIVASPSSNQTEEKKFIKGKSVCVCEQAVTIYTGTFLKSHNQVHKVH